MRYLALFLLLTATIHAAGVPTTGQRYFGAGFLINKGDANAPQFWMAAQPRGQVSLTPATKGVQEVRLVDGTYPWKLSSIFEQYGSIFPVLITGIVQADGSVALATLDPAHLPPVPVPLHTVSATLDGKILKIHCKVNRCIPREKCLVRLGGILTTYPSSTTAWVEVPDPYTSACNGDERDEVFELDLGKLIPPQFTSVYVHVRDGRCGEGHSVLYGDKPRLPEAAPAAASEPAATVEREPLVSAELEPGVNIVEGGAVAE